MPPNRHRPWLMASFADPGAMGAPQHARALSRPWRVAFFHRRRHRCQDRVCGLDHGPGGSCYIAAGYAGIYLATSMVRRVRLRR